MVYKRLFSRKEYSYQNLTGFTVGYGPYPGVRLFGSTDSFLNYLEKQRSKYYQADFYGEKGFALKVITFKHIPHKTEHLMENLIHLEDESNMTQTN